MPVKAKKSAVHVIFPEDIARILGALREASKEVAKKGDGKSIAPFLELYKAAICAFSTMIDAEPGDIVTMTLASVCVLPPPERAFELGKLFDDKPAPIPTGE